MAAARANSQAVLNAVNELKAQIQEQLASVNTSAARIAGTTPQMFENLGRHWRESAPGQDPSLVDRAKFIAVNKPMGGVLRAALENLGMVPDTARTAERVAAALTYGVGLPTAVAAADAMLSDGQTPDTLPMVNNFA